MRVLMIWSENLNKSGGARSHFVHIATSLAMLGNDVRIVAPGYSPKTTDDIGVPVSYLPTFKRGLLAFIFFHALLVFAMPFYLLRYRPTVVYTRGLFNSFMIYMICRLFRTPYVVEVNGISHLEMAMRGFSGLMVALVRFLERRSLRYATAFICVTRGLRREVIRHGAREDRVFAIHNGAPSDMFVPGDQAASRQQLGWPQDCILMGFVGMFVAWQGLDLLLEALSRIPKDARNWQMMLVGRGDLEDQLGDDIRTKGLEDRVILVPAVPHAEVPTVLAALDFEVVPINDARKLDYGVSPLKFWEALSVGLPTIVPDGADLGDVLEDLNWPGEFKTGDADDLARKMVETMERMNEYRGRRQELHQRVCKEYSWLAVARKTEEICRRYVRLRGE